MVFRWIHYVNHVQAICVFFWLHTHVCSVFTRHAFIHEFANQGSKYPSWLSHTYAVVQGRLYSWLTTSLVLAPMPKSWPCSVYADFLVAHSCVICWPYSASSCTHFVLFCRCALENQHYLLTSWHFFDINCFCSFLLFNTFGCFD